MSDDAISDALGIEHKQVEIIPPGSKELVPFDPDKDKAEEDFEMARRVIKNALLTGESALDEMHDIADNNQQARSYEVLSKLMKDLTDSAKTLYTLHKEKNDIIKGKPNIDPGPRSINVDKAVFVGNASDLLNHINK